MMPLDPYFTSADKSDDERRRKNGLRVCYAKTYQVRFHLQNAPVRNQEKAILRMCRRDVEGAQVQPLAADAAVNTIVVGGGNRHASRTGFKSPRKMWAQRGTSSN